VVSLLFRPSRSTCTSVLVSRPEAFLLHVDDEGAVLGGELEAALGVVEGEGGVVDGGWRR